MKRKVMFTGSLTAEERAVVMRFAIEIGDRAKCKTRTLLRPFTMDLLENAFREQEAEITARQKAYIESAKTFDPKTASPYLKDFLGEVTPEKYGKYVADLIRQEEEIKATLRKNYFISVDYAFLTKEDEAFHKSLSPRVAFQGTNWLHEACDFALTREIKDALLDSSLGSDSETEFQDYGTFYIGTTPVYYEDLEVTAADGETILSTVSHEEMLDLFLSEDDLKQFADFELNKARNRKIAKKLLS